MKRIAKIISVLLAAACTVSVFGGLTVSAATTQSLPFISEFSGGEISSDKGWTANGDLSVSDGKVLSSSTANANKVTLDFDPVDSGVLVFEADVHMPSVGAYDFISMNSSDGKKLFAVRTDGRGAGGTFVNVKNNDKTNYEVNLAMNNLNWGGAGVQDFQLKLEVDFDNNVWRFYQGYNGKMNQLEWLYPYIPTEEEKAQGKKEKSGGDFPFANDEDNAAQLTVILGMENTTLDNVRVYKKVTAEQTETEIEVLVGETKQAGIEYIPSGDTMGDMVWKSSDESVATVNASGLIEGKSAGTATITAKSAVYGVDFSYTVKVKLLDSMSVSAPSGVLDIGDTEKLTVSYTPENAKVDKDGIVWRSGNHYVATVDNNGNVTAVGKGTTEIYAAYAGFWASAKVTVSGTDSEKRSSLISFITVGNSFGDIADMEWAQNAIQSVAAAGIMTPDSETSFGAKRNVKRDEFVSVVIKTLGLENKKAKEPVEKTFEDVTEENTYYAEIMKAVELGIIEGVSDTSFAPDADITRQDMAVVISKEL